VKNYAQAGAQNASAVKARILAGMHHSAVTGYRPTCSCGTEPIPDLVLDPFAGSGTTLLVARKLGRNAVGIELSAEYVEMAKRRLGVLWQEREKPVRKQLERATTECQIAL